MFTLKKDHIAYKKSLLILQFTNFCKKSINVIVQDFFWRFLTGASCYCHPPFLRLLSRAVFLLAVALATASPFICSAAFKLPTLKQTRLILKSLQISTAN